MRLTSERALMPIPIYGWDIYSLRRTIFRMAQPRDRTTSDAPTRVRAHRHGLGRLDEGLQEALPAAWAVSR